MRLGRLEDTFVSLYLLFVLTCLYSGLIDLSRSLLSAKSVIPKRQSLLTGGAYITTYNKRVRDLVARLFFLTKLHDCSPFFSYSLLRLVGLVIGQIDIIGARSRAMVDTPTFQKCGSFSAPWF